MSSSTELTETGPAPTLPRQAAPPEQARDKPDDKFARWRLLVVLTFVGADVMDLLDSTIVNVAGPAVRRDIGASTSALQWIVAGYTLAFAAMLITGGRLGDVFGRKRMFLLGVAGFVASSAACSLAVDGAMLIGTRVVQGAFAAVMIPQGLGMIKKLFPPDEMAKVFAIFGPIMGVAATAGPIVGGALVDGNLFGLGWRAIFLINVPIGLAALVGSVRLLPNDADDDTAKPKLDLVGMVLATTSALLLIYPLVQGRDSGWPAWSWAMMAGSVPMLAIFAAHQRLRARAGRDPFVVTSLFRKRAFAGGIGLGVLFWGGMTGVFFALTLFLQLGLGFSPLRSGLTALPWSIGIMVAMGAGQAIMPKIGPRRMLQGGVAVMTVGVLGAAYTVHHLALATSSWDMAPALFIAGFGMGFVFAPYFGTVLAAVDDDEVGSAAGLINAVQQLGGSVGVAALGTLFFDRVAAHGYTGAVVPVFVISAIIIAACFLVGFLLPNQARDEVG